MQFGKHALFRVIILVKNNLYMKGEGGGKTY